jgi:hypothetical protein
MEELYDLSQPPAAPDEDRPHEACGVIGMYARAGKRGHRHQ